MFRLDDHSRAAQLVGPKLIQDGTDLGAVAEAIDRVLSGAPAEEVADMLEMALKVDLEKQIKDQEKEIARLKQIEDAAKRREEKEKLDAAVKNKMAKDPEVKAARKAKKELEDLQKKLKHEKEVKELGGRFKKVADTVRERTLQSPEVEKAKKDAEKLARITSKEERKKQKDAETAQKAADAEELAAQTKTNQLLSQPRQSKLGSLVQKAKQFFKP